MSVFRGLKRATRGYSAKDEDQFRRDIENYLLDLSAEINESVLVNSGLSSLASKRASLIASVPFGSTQI